MTKQNAETDGFSDRVEGAQISSKISEIKRGVPFASQDRTQTLYYTATNHSNNN